MVVDTSVILAILFQEEGASHYAQAIEATEEPMVSAANVTEAGIVMIARTGREGRTDLMDLLDAGGFRIEPVTAEHIDLALDAFERFGKGHGHPAGLNFGDCFAYALAKARGAPLIYKGDDFSHTDIPAW